MTDKILIIDDEELVRLTLRQTFEKLGYTVREASDGRRGVQAQRDDPADLIITDIVMPDQEGVETIIELRKEFPEVPIIAMSGGGRIGATDYLEHAQKFGASKVFEKPFDRKAIVAAARDLLGAG